jgi:hypothetical protein
MTIPKSEIKVEDKSLPQYLSDAQLEFISQKTPKQFIKTRPGPGGKSFSYVEIGYVINILNQAFGYDWDFKILDQQVGKTQVWVRGELSIRARGHTITKGQYGGAAIKLNRISGEPVSVADDLKAASSDCLKKCASMLGIAGDVYWTDLDSYSIGMDENPSQREQIFSHNVRR